MTSTEPAEHNEYQVRQAHEERVAVALARLGWITPIWIRKNEAESLLGDGNPDEVDAAFVEYYSNEGFTRYERLMRELPAANNRQWASLIRQMDAAYRRDDHAIVVPAAFVVLEGVLTRGQDNGPNLRDIVSKRVPGPPEGYSLHRVMWLAASELIGGLYAHHDFDGDAPPTLNRHWILHGRAASDWSQADSLRLLQACYVASYLALNAG
ncbi:MAG: hypothetical protein KJ747_05195 [Actinobacteria bacterium]|nr:hypothetical protein [Actinomycetota bacterium]MCG2807315.1 hypothetical protein [Coriobacteriia bacterium]